MEAIQQLGFDDLFKKSYVKQIKALKVAQLERLLTRLSIERAKKMNKAEMTEKVLAELQKMETKEIISALRQTNTGFAIEVKDLLANNVDIGTPTTVFTIDANSIPAFEVKYMIRRGVFTRTGTFIVVGSTDGTGGTLTTSDADAVQNGSTGVTFTVTESASTITFAYSSNNTGVTGTLYYSISYFQV